MPEGNVMMRRCGYSLTCTLLLVSTAVANTDYQVIAQEVARNAPHQMETYRNDARLAKAQAEKIVIPYQQYALDAKTKSEQLLGSNSRVDIKNETNKQPNSNIVIFVSLSMPDESLKAYLYDAKKIQASIVIRGLIDNSFKKTFTRVAELVKASGGDGIELNPIWFKQYGITQVPAVVVLADHRPCTAAQSCMQDREFDVITGNIPLASALKQIRDRGIAASNVAGNALQQMEDSH